MSADRARPNPRSLEELIVRYWDNALSPEELRELNLTLASSDEAQALFRQLCLQALSINEHFAVEKASAPADMVPFARRPGVGRRAWIAPATVAALLIAVALVGWVSRKPVEGPEPPPEPDGIARLEDFSGGVWVSSGEGDGAPARLKQPLRSGQTVSTSGNEGMAEIGFLDGTRLVLNGDTAVQVSDGDQKRLRVFHGNLAADVRPQPPGRPLILAMPETEVQVLGTKLSVSESKQKTVVAVVRGEVRVTQLADQQSLDLRSGQVATAYKGSKKLLLTRLSELPDTYALDFERLPADWGAGERIDAGLPPGSRFGMRAGPYHTHQFGTQYQVRSQNAWTSGLFELHEDSWLHLRFRMERPGFFHVLFVARGDDPTNKRGIVFEAPQFWRRRKAGVWYDASVPLGRSKALGSSPPEFQLPLVVYTIIVSSHVDDVGVAVDRLSVTRGPKP